MSNLGFILKKNKQIHYSFVNTTIKQKNNYRKKKKFFSIFTNYFSKIFFNVENSYWYNNREVFWRYDKYLANERLSGIFFADMSIREKIYVYKKLWSFKNLIENIHYFFLKMNGFKNILVFNIVNANYKKNYNLFKNLIELESKIVTLKFDIKKFIYISKNITKRLVYIYKLKTILNKLKKTILKSTKKLNNWKKKLNNLKKKISNCKTDLFNCKTDLFNCKTDLFNYTRTLFELKKKKINTKQVVKAFIEAKKIKLSVKFRKKVIKLKKLIKLKNEKQFPNSLKFKKYKLKFKKYKLKFKKYKLKFKKYPIFNNLIKHPNDRLFFYNFIKMCKLTNFNIKLLKLYLQKIQYFKNQKYLSYILYTYFNISKFKTIKEIKSYTKKQNRIIIRIKKYKIIKDKYSPVFNKKDILNLINLFKKEYKIYRKKLIPVYTNINKVLKIFVLTEIFKKKNINNKIKLLNFENIKNYYFKLINNVSFQNKYFIKAKFVKKKFNYKYLYNTVKKKYVRFYIKKQKFYYKGLFNILKNSLWKNILETKKRKYRKKIKLYKKIIRKKFKTLFFYSKHLKFYFLQPIRFTRKGLAKRYFFGMKNKIKRKIWKLKQNVWKIKKKIWINIKKSNKFMLGFNYARIKKNIIFCGYFKNIKWYYYRILLIFLKNIKQKNYYLSIRKKLKKSIKLKIKLFSIYNPIINKKINKKYDLPIFFFKKIYIKKKAAFIATCYKVIKWQIRDFKNIKKYTKKLEYTLYTKKIKKLINNGIKLNFINKKKLEIYKKTCLNYSEKANDLIRPELYKKRLILFINTKWRKETYYTIKNQNGDKVLRKNFAEHAKAKVKSSLFFKTIETHLFNTLTFDINFFKYNNLLKGFKKIKNYFKKYPLQPFTNIPIFDYSFDEKLEHKHYLIHKTEEILKKQNFILKQLFVDFVFKTYEFKFICSFSKPQKNKFLIEWVNVRHKFIKVILNKNSLIYILKNINLNNIIFDINYFQSKEYNYKKIYVKFRSLNLFNYYNVKFGFLITMLNYVTKKSSLLEIHFFVNLKLHLEFRKYFVTKYFNLNCWKNNISFSTLSLHMNLFRFKEYSVFLFKQKVVYPYNEFKEESFNLFYLKFKKITSLVKYFLPSLDVLDFSLKTYTKSWRMYTPLENLLDKTKLDFSFFLIKNKTFINHKKKITSRLMFSYLKKEHRKNAAFKYLKYTFTFNKTTFFNQKIIFFIKFVLFSQHNFINVYLNNMFIKFNKNLKNKLFKTAKYNFNIEKSIEHLKNKFYKNNKIVHQILKKNDTN